MSTRRHALAPLLAAVLIGAAAPAWAEDAPPTAEPTAVASSEPTEAASEPTPESTPETGANTPPSAEQSTQPSGEPTPEPTPTSATPEPTTAAPSHERKQKSTVRPQALSLPTTGVGLVAALAACEDGDTVVLGADVALDSRLVIACDATLDLNGMSLTTQGVEILEGHHGTITDSGTGGALTTAGTAHYTAGIKVTGAELTISGGEVTAIGGEDAAGIGGGDQYNGSLGAAGTITITGGTVNATGGEMAAGIGGAGWGDPGTVTITGGTVDATAGAYAAGIGGGYNRGGGTVTITGGTVTARSSTTGAGIGTALYGWESGPITIGADATVTASSATGSAIGNSGNPNVDRNQQVRIDGTVHLTGKLDTSKAAYTIGETGRVLGAVGNETSGLSLTGAGTIANDGVVVSSDIGASVKATGNHYQLIFNTNGGSAVTPFKVLAPTLGDGLVTLPTTTMSGSGLVGWLLNGSRVTRTTSLGAKSTNGSATYVILTADWGVATASGLQSALSTCPGGTVVLGGDITSASRLGVSCDVTLDLNGHTLETDGVDLSPGVDLTVGDTGSGGRLVTDGTTTNGPGIRTSNATLTITGGTIVATGGYLHAGIGGTHNTDGGDTTISGGTVTARGGAGAAGIGSSEFGSGGSVSISGGIVTATGGQWAAGIGGGNASALDSISITGGTVTATGGQDGAGVGAGAQHVGTDVLIGAGADVTAIVGPATAGYGPASVVGVSSHHTSDYGVGGDVEVDGTLRIPSGTVNLSKLSSFTVGATGRVLGTTADPTTGGSLSGTGTIANAGVIALTDVADTVAVTGHHYEVSASTGTVTVYGPSVAAGHRSLPAAPARGVDAFAGWTHDGDPFTATTSLPGTSADGTAVEVDLDAIWDEGAAAFDPAGPLALAAAVATDVDLTLTDGAGDPVAVDPEDWTVSTPTGVSLTHDDDGWHLTGTTPVAGDVTASVTVDGRTYTATLPIEVAAGAPSALSLSFTGTAKQGESVTIAVTGTDAAGNDLGDLSDEVTLTSSVATDVIDGNTVTFPHASPHVITATHASGATASLLIEVEALPVEVEPTDEPTAEPTEEPTEATDEATASDPAPDVDEGDRDETGALADTGTTLAPWAAGLGLLLLGLGVVVLRRRRA